MIRDPSDGSVRNAKGITPAPNENKEVDVKTPSEGITSPVIETTTSGLPAASAKDADRHARSREWLAGYRSGYPYFCTDCDEGRAKLTEDGRCTMCHGARIITIAGKIKPKSEEQP